MSELFFETLIKITYLPLFIQSIIVVPFSFVISYSCFYIIRLMDIGITGSEEEYYRTSYDPLTSKRLLQAALWCTGFLVGGHLLILFNK